MIDKIKDCVHIQDAINGTFTMEKIFDDPNMSYIADLHCELPTRLYEPKKDDKIYFVPGCDIPRFKVKKFCEEFDVAVVKYKEKASVIFVGANSIREYFEGIGYEYVTCYDKKTFIGFLEKRKYSLNHESLLAALKDSTSNCVMIEHDQKIIYRNAGFTHSELQWNEKPKIMMKNTESYQHIVDIQDSELYYNQQELLRRINTGNVMNEEAYISIQRMLKSTDQGNVTLAMETMANCDYEKSALHLLLLLKEHSNTFYVSKTKNHVNFKSLLKFFNINNLGSYYLNDVLASLLYTKLLNQTTLNKLMPEVQESLNAGKYFEIKELTYGEEILKGLSENILDINCDTEIVDEPQEEIKCKFITLNLAV